jgi:hypothetical protein
MNAIFARKMVKLLNGNSCKLLEKFHAKELLTLLLVTKESATFLAARMMTTTSWQIFGNLT